MTPVGRERLGSGDDEGCVRPITGRALAFVVDSRPMRSLPILGALFVGLIPAAASAETTIIQGDVALASFEHVSTDGCVHTVGEIALVDGSDGAPNPNGVYVTGSREDVCAGTGMGFAALVEGQVQMLGLLYAHYEGSFIAPSYSGGDDVAFDVDLTWIGKGRVTHERNVVEDDTGSTTTRTSRRDAKVRGTLRADGVRMTVASASLVHETVRTITR